MRSSEMLNVMSGYLGCRGQNPSDLLENLIEE